MGQESSKPSTGSELDPQLNTGSESDPEPNTSSELYTDLVYGIVTENEGIKFEEILFQVCEKLKVEASDVTDEIGMVLKAFEDLQLIRRNEDVYYYDDHKKLKHSEGDVVESVDVGVSTSATLTCAASTQTVTDPDGSRFKAQDSSMKLYGEVGTQTSETFTLSPNVGPPPEMKAKKKKKLGGHCQKRKAVPKKRVKFNKDKSLNTKGRAEKPEKKSNVGPPPDVKPKRKKKIGSYRQKRKAASKKRSKLNNGMALKYKDPPGKTAKKSEMDNNVKCDINFKTGVCERCSGPTTCRYARPLNHVGTQVSRVLTKKTICACVCPCCEAELLVTKVSKGDKKTGEN